MGRIMRIEAIDLFCGIGGLTYGLQQAKIKVLAGLDNDNSCEFHRNNIGFYDFNPS
jgi:DNA (cytosine-5)-methyltransferase 1